MCPKKNLKKNIFLWASQNVIISVLFTTNKKCAVPITYFQYFFEHTLFTVHPRNKRHIRPVIRNSLRPW